MFYRPNWIFRKTKLFKMNYYKISSLFSIQVELCSYPILSLTILHITLITEWLTNFKKMIDWFRISVVADKRTESIPGFSWPALQVEEDHSFGVQSRFAWYSQICTVLLPLARWNSVRYMKRTEMYRISASFTINNFSCLIVILFSEMREMGLPVDSFYKALFINHDLI